MGLREQSAVGFFPKWCFFQLLGAGAFGVAKKFVNNFVFPTLTCDAGFNINYYYYFIQNLSFNLGRRITDLLIPGPKKLGKNNQLSAAGNNFPP